MDRQQSQIWNYFQKITFCHACTACYESPSYLNTMHTIQFWYRAISWCREDIHPLDPRPPRQISMAALATTTHPTATWPSPRAPSAGEGARQTFTRHQSPIISYPDQSFKKVIILTCWISYHMYKKSYSVFNSDLL